MNDCLFCKIVNGEIPSTKVYEDDKALAFLDITPVSTGHTLLVPKKHSKNVLDAEDDVLAKISPILKKVSIAVKKGTGADGINIHINNEPAAGQVVPHLHMHIIPRYSDDELHLWKGDEAKYSEDIAKNIKEAL